MIRDAELFVMSEDVLVEVIGRVRNEDRGIEMRPLAFRATDVAEPVRRRIARHVHADLGVPDLLAGREPPGGQPSPDVLGDDAAGAARAAAGKASDAARDVEDPEQALLLRRLTIERAILAHDLAFHLGSRACPLTENLARGLCELVEPEDEQRRWRSEGLFAEALTPMPEDVSWRDRFFMVSGRDPHPFVPH